MVNDLGVIIVAGGSSRRFGGGNKLLLELDGIPVFCHSIRTFLPYAAQMAVVAPAGELETFRLLAEQFLPGNGARFVPGGAFRSASVQAGLRALEMNTGIVAVHDAARPLADGKLLLSLIERAREVGGAIPGKPVTDTLKRSDDSGLLCGTVDRDHLWRVETPQVFSAERLCAAYQLNPATDFTDDAGALSAAGFSCAIVSAPAPNPKITFAGDFAEVARLLAERHGSES